MTKFGKDWIVGAGWVTAGGVLSKATGIVSSVSRPATGLYEIGLLQAIDFGGFYVIGLPLSVNGVASLNINCFLFSPTALRFLIGTASGVDFNSDFNFAIKRMPQ